MQQTQNTTVLKKYYMIMCVCGLQVMVMVGINPVSDALGRVNKLEVPFWFFCLFRFTLED